MNVNYERSFLKDIKKLDDKAIAKKLKSILTELENTAVLQDMQNIKKLKGYDIYYRLKILDYRLGFSHENGEINIIRFLHRKEIYKLFP